MKEVVEIISWVAQYQFVCWFDFDWCVDDSRGQLNLLARKKSQHLIDASLFWWRHRHLRDPDFHRSGHFAGISLLLRTNWCSHHFWKILFIILNCLSKCCSLLFSKIILKPINYYLYLPRHKNWLTSSFNLNYNLL